tara:strand:+ start:213 stop:671 length:459 start_codon:yes stop_codon:yes gene_type:complete
MHKAAISVLILGFMGLVISAGSIYFGSQSEIEDDPKFNYGGQLVGLGCLGTVFSCFALFVGMILALSLRGNQPTSGQVILVPGSSGAGGQNGDSPNNEPGHPDSSKTGNPFRTGGSIGIVIGLIGIASLLILYFLFRYLIWYFDAHIAPLWL